MTEKRYLLTETELLELLEDRYRLAALEAMGVDNKMKEYPMFKQSYGLISYVKSLLRILL